MSLYLTVILITILLMITMTIHVLNYSGFNKTEKTWYVATFLSVALCAGAEYLAKHFDGRGYAVPLTIITVIQFSLAPLLPVFFSGALGMSRLAKRAGLLFLVNVLIEIISAPFGWVFYFDENGTYVRGSLYIIYEAFYIIGLVFLIISLVLAGRKFQKRDIWTIVMVLVVMVASIVPLLLFKVYADYMGIGISACLCYIYYNDLIQEDIQAQLIENQKKISDMQDHIILGLASLIESRDVETGEHIARTGQYVKTLAEDARADGVYTDQLTDHFISLLCTLAPMHDIGKILVSDQILKKPGRLTSDEFEQMKRHSSEGGAVVQQVLSGITDEEYRQFAVDIVVGHHERWDGKGYPRGLKGEKIPLSARIMAIADVYDALISERCYKKAIPVEEAVEIIKEESGTHFDPKLVEVFLRHKEEFGVIS